MSLQPLQIYPTLKWVTIPATGIISFVFFGFLVAGEEIESTCALVDHGIYSVSLIFSSSADPFGYDKNDLVSSQFLYTLSKSNS